LPAPYEHYSISDDGKTILRAGIQLNGRQYEARELKQFPNRYGTPLCMIKDDQAYQTMKMISHIQALANGLIPNFEYLIGKRIKNKDGDKNNLHIDNLELVICKRAKPREKRKRKNRKPQQPLTGIIRLKPKRYVAITEEYRHIGTYSLEQDAKDSLDTYNKYGCELNKIIKKEKERGLRRKIKRDETTI
jgi:hypothetical protein